MSEQIVTKAQLDLDDAGTLTGLAWAFDAADSVGDVITKGAVIEFPEDLPILVEHDQRAVIGTWKSVDITDAGLEVRGKLFVEGVGPARSAREQIKKGVIGGLSIGFSHSGFERLPSGGRQFNRIAITEISICKHPVHHLARISEVKSEPTPEPIETKEVNTMAAAEKIEDNVHIDQTAEIKALIAQNARNEQRIGVIEARANRLPVGEPQNDNDQTETKALLDYVRSGDRSEMKALSLAAGSGGVLAPSEFRTSIIQKLTQFSPVRSVAEVIKIGGSSTEYPRLVTDVTVGEVTETSARPESEPSFDKIEIKPFEMSVIVPVTRLMLEDSQINMEAYLRNYLAKRYGEKESGWFINGNGTSQAEGVLTSPDVANALTTASGTAITADELIDTFYAIPTPYSTNGHWLMNRATMARIRKLKDADGSYLWQPSLAAGQPATILGRPVLEAPHMPNVALGSTPIVFGDFNAGYLIADRVDFEFDTDTKSAWGNGLVKLLTRRRVGGRVVLGEALTKVKMKAS